MILLCHNTLAKSYDSKVGLIIQKRCILVTVFAALLLPILLYACYFFCCSLVANTAVFLVTGYSESVRLVASINPSNATYQTLHWESSNNSVATVDANGNVTAIAGGDAIITVTSRGQSANCSVVVTVPVSSISLDKTKLDLSKGDTASLTATVSPSDATDKTISWNTSDSSVATVNNGKVTAVGGGTTTITASSNGLLAECLVSVTVPVSSIALNHSSLSLFNGQSEALVANVSPSDASNSAVSWSSSNPSIVSVTSSGIITGVSRGNATITATAVDGSNAMATCDVEVMQHVTGMTLNETAISLPVGDSFALSVTIIPEDANDKSYYWISSDNSVVDVDFNGVISAQKVGSATITAVSNDDSGVSVSCSVSTYNPDMIVDLGLSVKWATVNLGETGFVNSSEERGELYAWGETMTKSTYGWATYWWCEGSDWKSILKYNTSSVYGAVDNKTVLETGPNGDDVASKILGGKWRMPTADECCELRNNCVWEKISGDGYREIKGYKLTSRKQGYTDKWIFLPAMNEKRGYYWSSSLAGNCNMAFALWFAESSSRVDPFDVISYDRCMGSLIRPVLE